jgi:hypothetical protein
MSAPGRSNYVPESFDVEDLFDVPSSYRENSSGIRPVRTLKPPPEIWELVHPVAPKNRTPVMAFVNRITSNGTTLMVLIVAALALGGVSAFLIVRPDKFETTSNPKTSNVQRPRPTQSGVAGTVPTTPPQTNLAPTDSAVGIQPSTTVTPETLSQVPDSTTPKRVRPAKKPVAVSQYAVAERVGIKNSETQPAAESSAEKKDVVESAATKPKANASASPQLVAPAKPSDSPKPKVIQWP